MAKDLNKVEAIKNIETERPKVRMFYDHILTTMDMETMTKSGIIISPDKRGNILTRQTVVAAGPAADVKVGEVVEIHLGKFPRQRIPAKNGIGPDGEIIIPPVEIINEKTYLLLSTRELKYVYE